MIRKILGVVAGLVAWIAVVFVVGEIMRRSWPAYESVAAEMKFTLPMLFARLAISVLATLTMGMVAAALAPSSLWARLAPGILLLAAFIPQHISIWDKFPIWYHLGFLLTLVPLTYLGGMLAPQRGLHTNVLAARVGG
ncbi:MAG TPA: hypothetical protein VH583_02210 [Vicinamibacterales bacterium]|jgi:hypothetical protein